MGHCSWLLKEQVPVSGGISLSQSPFDGLDKGKVRFGLHALLGWGKPDGCELALLCMSCVSLPGVEKSFNVVYFVKI